MSLDTDSLITIGTGITVFRDDAVIEAPTIWLGSPDAVIDFVDRDDTEDFIVIARGGTTTFLTPALVAGVKGIVTLQGAPTSHLGIISREYGIPCLMSVTFAQGEENERGEIIPPDGTLLRLDVSTSPQGRVLVASDSGLTRHGAPASQSVDEGEPERASAPAEPLRFANGVVGGSEGEKIMEGQMVSDVLHLTDESLGRDLTDVEVNDLLNYYGWNVWDILIARLSEGESGLIPRPEYELLGIYSQWRLHPRWHRMITEKIGVDGLREVGASARTQVGTKVNLLHIWSSGVPLALGRGVAIELGTQKASENVDDLRNAMQFTRRLYRGLWDDNGHMMTAGRGYAAPILERELQTKFWDERTVITDDAQRKEFQRFNGVTGITSFLLHFDNRCGVADSGPYPTPDGGWMLVRDHVVNEKEYPWAGPVSDLPYAITIAMFFDGAVPIEKSLVDIGTMFTEPANYLKALSGYTIYQKDTEQTPMSELKLLKDADLPVLTAKTESASSKLYPTIASMSDREKIEAGARVYYTDFIAPIAKASGVWQDILDAGFYDLGATADEVYDLITDGRAGTMLPMHFGAGVGLHRI
jgi:phosphohistidine swiveling domain-containing protein